MKNRAVMMAEEALLLCGTAFRLHGRDTKNGVDCVGLADLCASAAGLDCNVPTGYSIRGGNINRVTDFLMSAGFEKMAGSQKINEGDLVLVQPSPVQLHFLICAQDGFVHAHAGLRKVVFSPGPCPWPIIEIFRLKEA